MPHTHYVEPPVPRLVGRQAHPRNNMAHLTPAAALVIGKRHNRNCRWQGGRDVDLWFLGWCGDLRCRRALACWGHASMRRGRISFCDWGSASIRRFITLGRGHILAVVAGHSAFKRCLCHFRLWRRLGLLGGRGHLRTLARQPKGSLSHNRAACQQVDPQHNSKFTPTNLPFRNVHATTLSALPHTNGSMKVHTVYTE